jgi:HAD superfamily hydrolase (TIGR01549 family)
VIRAVIFDVGYTLIDEKRQWAEWARELGVSSEQFMETLVSVIAERKHHRTVFARLRPNFDLNAALARRDQQESGIWTEEDLYEDARPALARLRAAGLQVALAGNQPPTAKRALERMNLPVDWIANSSELGFEKPAPEFFAKIAARAGSPAQQIAYVGDRLDNHVLPAQAAGMRGVFLVRGPWGKTHARWPEAAEANQIVSGLEEMERDELWPPYSPT